MVIVNREVFGQIGLGNSGLDKVKLLWRLRIFDMLLVVSNSNEDLYFYTPFSYFHVDCF